MTDEQIKRNAKAYAVIETACNSCQRYCERGFIAGAHSRDEEIKDLEERLEYADESIADADKWIAKYKLELDKLRNPWIDINVKLPEVKKRVLFLCNNGMAYFGYNNIDNKSATITNAPDGVKVTHWMPIPELKKGGEQ